jgi:serine/threonine protein phosphatase PrpC
VKDHAVKEDANSKGQKKTKKKAAFGFTIKGHDMEDQHYIEVPFANEEKQALFCVFDGHGGADCAIAAKQKFSGVCFNFVTV